MNSSVVEPYGNWDQTPDHEKKIVRDRKRQMYYTSNIYVIKDPQNPENEGKVFLFRYGKKIMEKIKLAIKPEFGEEPFDPYNPWSGANFMFKIRKVDRQTNYDQSSFSEPAPMLDSDEAIEAVADQLYDLSEFTSEEFCAEYDKQKADLERVLGLNRSAANEPPAEEAPAAQAAPEPETAPETETNDLADQAELKSLFDDDDDVPF